MVSRFALIADSASRRCGLRPYWQTAVLWRFPCPIPQLYPAFSPSVCNTSASSEAPGSPGNAPGLASIRPPHSLQTQPQGAGPAMIFDVRPLFAVHRTHDPRRDPVNPYFVGKSSHATPVNPAPIMCPGQSLQTSTVMEAILRTTGQNIRPHRTERLESLPTASRAILRPQRPIFSPVFRRVARRPRYLPPCRREPATRRLPVVRWDARAARTSRAPVSSSQARSTCRPRCASSTARTKTAHSSRRQKIVSRSAVSRPPRQPPALVCIRDPPPLFGKRDATAPRTGDNLPGAGARERPARLPLSACDEPIHARMTARSSPPEATPPNLRTAVLTSSSSGRINSGLGSTGAGPQGSRRSAGVARYPPGAWRLRSGVRHGTPLSNVRQMRSIEPRPKLFAAPGPHDHRSTVVKAICLILHHITPSSSPKSESPVRLFRRPWLAGPRLPRPVNAPGQTIPRSHIIHRHFTFRLRFARRKRNRRCQPATCRS